MVMRGFRVRCQSLKDCGAGGERMKDELQRRTDRILMTS